MILAVLQARMSSTRLPGKVLMPLMGKPMLLRQIERVSRSKCIDKLLVATSTESADDAIAALCHEHGIECHRGALADVLDRFYSAALAYMPDHVVRLTADCPLADPELIDEVIRFYLAGDFDYASDVFEPTFPDGLDVEVFRFPVLAQAWRDAKLPSEREHVTAFIHQQPQVFRIGSFKGVEDLSSLRWTVDEPADLEFVSHVYSELYPQNNAFSWKDVLRLLERRPELRGINVGLVRNEGYIKSLVADREFVAAAKSEEQPK